MYLPCCIYSSATAHLSPPPCLFERNCSCIAPTVSICAQLLTGHLRQIYSSASARWSHQPCLFERNRSYIAPPYLFECYARPPPCLFEHNCLCIASAVSNLSAGTHPLALPCLFERNRSPEARHSLATSMCTCACMPAVVRPRPVPSQVWVGKSQPVPVA